MSGSRLEDNRNSRLTFSRSARLVYLVAAFVLIGSGAYILFQKRSEAIRLSYLDSSEKLVTEEMSNGAQTVKLPSSIASTLRGRNADSRPATVDAQVDKLIAAAARKGGADSSLLLADSTGNPLIAESENNDSTASPAPGDACVPSWHVLKFTITDTFTPQEKIAVQHALDAFYPKLLNIYGAPLYDRTIKIRKVDDLGDNSGLYTSLDRTIRLKSDLDYTDVINGDYQNSFARVLAHEMTHAWRHRSTIGDKRYEEGIARFTENYVIGDTQTQDYDVINPYFNEALIMSQPSIWPYNYGSAVFAKINIENPSFLKNFHCELYKHRGWGTGTSWQQAKEAVLASATTVEGLPISTWFSQQLYFNPPATTGVSFFPKGLDVELRESRRLWTQESKIDNPACFLSSFKCHSYATKTLSNKKVLLRFQDINRQEITRIDCYTDANGETNIKSCILPHTPQANVLLAHSNTTVTIEYVYAEENVRTSTTFVMLARLKSYNKEDGTVSDEPSEALIISPANRIAGNKNLGTGTLTITNNLNHYTTAVPVTNGEFGDSPAWLGDYAPYTLTYKRQSAATKDSIEYTPAWHINRLTAGDRILL